MKTFLKIAALAIAVIGAVGSIFVFNGTRIVKGVDVSNINIQDSVYVNDIQNQIDEIGNDWLDGFNKVDNLISAYYHNRLLSADNEKKVKTSLVEKAALRLTTYVLTDYFMRSSWNQSNIASFERNTRRLLNYKSASGDKVAQGDTKSQLEIVQKTCQNYTAARNMSLVYTSNDDARRKIKRAQELCNDTYLMHESSIKNKLQKAERTIHNSHYNKIKDGIKDLQTYSYPYGDDRLLQTSDFNTFRSKVSAIKTLIDNYQQADFYSSKNATGLDGMKTDLNDIIGEWNKMILSEREESYTDYSSYPYQQKNKKVRIFPNELPINNL